MLRNSLYQSTGLQNACVPYFLLRRNKLEASPVRTRLCFVELAVILEGVDVSLGQFCVVIQQDLVHLLGTEPHISVSSALSENQLAQPEEPAKRLPIQISVIIDELDVPQSG
jgi:hypothetical protein